MKDGMRENTAMTTQPANRSKLRACTFELTGSEFLDVAIAGSFNDWRPRAMKRTQEGLWKVTLRLPPGTYEYKFIADGKWLEDPKNPKRVANPYFTQNSVQTVS